MGEERPRPQAVRGVAVLVRRLVVSAVVAVAVIVVAAPVAAHADLLPPLPLPLPLPLPTPTTTQPSPSTTTTTVPGTSTTTSPPSSSTTRPPATTTTTRPRTTTTTAARRTPTTTGGSRAGSSGAVVANGDRTSTSTRASARDARRRVPAATTGRSGRTGPPDARPSADGPAGVAPADTHLPETGGDPAVALGGTAPGSADAAGLFDAMPGPLVLAGLVLALVLGVAVLARRRAHDPYLRAAHLGAGTFVVERDDEESVVADRLAIGVRSGPVRVVGRDCRGLQLLVKVAAREGLEIVDPDGYLVQASRRLVEAKDLVPDRRKLPLAWTVTVERVRVPVEDGWNVRSTGAGDGRVLSFAPGSSLVLWDGDCLR